MNLCKCFSCGGLYPEIEGAVHPYMSSTPGCWSAFGDILAREYSDSAFFEAHRLAVDAYALQHPGTFVRQSIQSVGLHLIRLCLFLEHDLTAECANDAMFEAAKKKHSFTYLEPPTNFGNITAADVAKANSAVEHMAFVSDWAKSVWSTWERHHDTVKASLPDKAL